MGSLPKRRPIDLVRMPLIAPLAPIAPVAPFEPLAPIAPVAPLAPFAPIPLIRLPGARPIRQLYGNLSADTRYLRFFSPMPQLPDSVLRLITAVDYYRRVGLIAELHAADTVRSRGRNASRSRPCASSGNAERHEFVMHGRPRSSVRDYRRSAVTNSLNSASFRSDTAHSDILSRTQWRTWNPRSVHSPTGRLSDAAGQTNTLIVCCRRW